MRKLGFVFRDTARIYLNCQIPRSAAALAYYFTMTVFPMLIFLYALFGRNYSAAMRVLNHFSEFLSSAAMEMIQKYLEYISFKNRDGILLAAAMVMLMPASAAIRALETAISEMQGGRRFRMTVDIPLSVLLSVALVLVFYFAIAVVLTGHNLLRRLARRVPVIRVALWGPWLRYLLLGGAVMLIVWGIYAISRRREDRYRAWPGALLATAAIVISSFLFSLFISASTHYSLVYGSLASLILLMFWLFLTCQMILTGAAFNIALRNHTAPKH